MKGEKLFYLVVIGFLVSCSGTINKEWTVTNFDETSKFSILVEEDKSVNNANIFLEGDFTGTVILSSVENDSALYYIKENLPKERIFVDFYGGEFEFFLAPSDAKGRLKVTVEIPYY